MRTKSIKKLIKATEAKDAVTAKRIAGKLIREKVMEKIKQKEKQIAKKYFK